MPEECVHIDAFTESEIPGPATNHPFARSCQGSWLAAAGCQAHNPEQRRVWTTQEISVLLQSGGRIALLGPRVSPLQAQRDTGHVPPVPLELLSLTCGQPRGRSHFTVKFCHFVDTCEQMYDVQKAGDRKYPREFLSKPLRENHYFARDCQLNVTMNQNCHEIFENARETCT